MATFGGTTMFGYDEFFMDDNLNDILKKYNAEKDFEKWLEASLIVQGNQGDINYYPTYFITEKEYPVKRGKVELQLYIHDGSHSYFSPQNGDIDLDYLKVELQKTVEHKTTSEKVLEYITYHPGVTKKAIAKALKMRADTIHNALVDICYHDHLVEEVSGPETGYKLVKGKPQDIQTVFRDASKSDKVNMLTKEKNIYKLKDMLKTLTGGFSSAAFNVQDNVDGLIGPIWPTPLIKAKDLLAKEYGETWAYSGD